MLSAFGKMNKEREERQRKARYALSVKRKERKSFPRVVFALLLVPLIVALIRWNFVRPWPQEIWSIAFILLAAGGLFAVANRQEPSLDSEVIRLFASSLLTDKEQLAFAATWQKLCSMYPDTHLTWLAVESDSWECMKRKRSLTTFGITAGPIWNADCEAIARCEFDESGRYLKTIDITVDGRCGQFHITRKEQRRLVATIKHWKS